MRRLVLQAQAQRLVAGEIAQGWQGATREKYDMRLRDAAAGRCIALCASLAGAPVGYINLYFKAFPPYENTDWPEIVDFGVLEKHRRSGIGTALMDAAEALAAKIKGCTVTLQVKGGASGKLYGKVTAKDVADALSKQTGAEVDKKKVELPASIKEFGVCQAQVRLYAGVTAAFNIKVEPLA